MLIETKDHRQDMNAEEHEQGEANQENTKQESPRIRLKHQSENDHKYDVNAEESMCVRKE